MPYLYREGILHAVKNKGTMLSKFEEFQDDEEIVLEAVKNDKSSIIYASSRLKDDKKFVLKAIKIDTYILRFISKRLKDDKEVVLEAIKANKNKNNFILKFISNRLKDNKEIVMKAIKTNCIDLKYASPRLRDDEDVIRTAVNINGWTLHYASERIMKKMEIVYEAMLNYYSERKSIYEDSQEKNDFSDLEDRGIGYLGTLELIFNEIESYGEEVKKKCCFNDNTSWLETKRIYIEYYTKNMMESNYLWSCISELSNSLSEALK